MKVVVVLSNEKHSGRAMDTIRMVRTAGRWERDVVWVAVGFDPDEEFISRWNVTVLKRPVVETQWLWDLRQEHPMRDTDGRDQDKLFQFSKWRVFDPFFKKWRSLLYLDAGTHVSNPIHPIFNVPHVSSFVAPDDRFPFNDPQKTFLRQWDVESVPDRGKDLLEYCKEIDPEWPEYGGYFLNCLWLMDTSLITDTTINDLTRLMRRFPISRTNEMAVMNLHFHPVWKALPECIGKDRLFDWTERFGRTTSDYIFLKYPHFPVVNKQ